MAVKRKPLSARVVATLKTKAKKSKLFNLTDLKASFRRGQGAFLSSGSRPKIPMQAWAMARVNAYLYLLRNGRPSNPNYTTDNDLLPKGHPRSSKK